MEDTDMSALGRVLDGIASTAAWVCFYNIDVLTSGVISQLALELNAIKMEEALRIIAEDKSRANQHVGGSQAE